MTDHIEIIKEDLTPLYGRFRQNKNPPHPQPRSRGEQGIILKNELAQAVTSIANTRQDKGIDTDNLLVLEILSDAISTEILDRMLDKFKLWLVEEVTIPNTNNTRLVVQFEDKAAIDAFENERERWEKDDQTDGILTYSQRTKLFECLERIRQLSRQDRLGQRLKHGFDSGQALPDGTFIVNIDVWYNGDRSTITQLESQVRRCLGTSGELLGDLFELSSLLLGRAKVNEFSLNALLDMDIIAMVDLPMGTLATELCELYVSDFKPIVDNSLNDSAPLAAIIDSGIFTGNPLLASLIVGEEDFDNSEHTTTDLHGHGTAVAGIVAYGDLSNFSNPTHRFVPHVRLCNGKVMHKEDDGPRFSDDKRPEQIVKEAITYFNQEYNCRIFNLSAGDDEHVYSGGRQLAWAAMLDDLISELDIVIVVSSGNKNPEIPIFNSRDELCEKTRNQLLTPPHRLIDPATTALGITVGSITRYSEPESFPNRGIPISAGEADFPSVFTRTGKGVGGAIKPEFVDYGGNYALHQVVRGQENSRWQKNNRLLMEPTLNHTTEKVFRGYCGTSFSAPHVTHIAARLEQALLEQLSEPPSSNLIRALLGSSAKYGLAMRTWVDSARDPDYTGEKNRTQEWMLRLIGYGKVDEKVLFSGERQVTLFAEDKLDLSSLHLYKIPVPLEFLNVKGSKRISIGFAYNPPTRLSRKAYIANSLWVEVFRRTDADNLLAFIAKKESGNDEDAENIFEKFRNTYGAKFSPGYTEIQNSTLQQRVWEKGVKGGQDLLWNENDPYIYVLITGKEKFNHPDKSLSQPYALAINFSYDATTDIKLYQKLKANVRIKERERERERIRGRAQAQI